MYCQLDNLRRCMPSSIRKALNELPDTLDDTYERILQSIPKQKWQHAQRLFQCMVAALRPLWVEELAEIFAIGFGANVSPNLVEDWRPPNAEEAVLSACSSLITIIDDQGSKIVQFSHFSVKEYLTSDRLETSNVVNIRQFYIPLEPAHTTLARACLAVLLQLDGRADEERLAGFPLASYAARNWVDHAKFENVACQVQDGMEELFNPTKPHLRTWIQIHNVTRRSRRQPKQIDEYPSIELYYAAFCGFSGLAKHLIITHALDVNAKFHSGYTPLHAASLQGHTEVAQLLLDCEADIHARSNKKWMPLHIASSKGHLEVTQLLLERGAALDEQTDYMSTPLSLASFHGKLEAVRLLLAHGADMKIRNEGGLTPFQSATSHDIAQLLLDHGAEVEDEESKTILKI